MNATFVGGGPDRVINEIYIYLAKGPDGEGIMAADSTVAGQRAMMPMFSTNEKTIRGFAPLAAKMAKSQGIEFGIFKFSNKQDVTAQFCELPKQESCERARELFDSERDAIPALAAQFADHYIAKHGLSANNLHRAYSIYAQLAEGSATPADMDSKCLARADDRAWFAGRK